MSHVLRLERQLVEALESVPASSHSGNTTQQATPTATPPQTVAPAGAEKTSSEEVGVSAFCLL